MTTRYQVRVATPAARPDAEHESTVRCTCGWSVTLYDASPAIAVQSAARARANHLEDAHPHQVVGLSRSDGHELLIGGSTKEDHLWTRYAVCGCGSWEGVVTERSPDRVAAVMRTGHRRHVMHETGRAPLRDYVVLLALIAVIAVIMYGLTTATLQASGV